MVKRVLILLLITFCIVGFTKDECLTTSKEFYLAESIKLKADNEKSFFSSINIIKIFDNKILICDSYDSKKICVFDFNGNFIGNVGYNGEGPGGFVQPSQITVLEDRIVVFDNMKLFFHIFRRDNFKFIKKITLRKEAGFFTPVCSTVINKKIYFYSPRFEDKGSKAIYVTDLNLNYLNSFFNDEKEFDIISEAGLNNLTSDKFGHIWIANRYNPFVYVLDNGSVVKMIDLSKTKDFMFKSSLMKNVKKREFDKFFKVSKGYSYINGLFKLNNQIVLHYSHKGDYFQFYNVDKIKLENELLFKEKFKLFKCVENNYFVFYNIWSDKIENENLNGIVYLYKVKNSVK